MSQARSGSSVGQGALELGRGLLGGVRLEDAALGLDDLPQRPEGDPLAVGQAAALAPGDELGALVDVLEELGAEPALAHARLADDRHQLAGALLRGALERPDQQRLLELATHERSGVRAGHVRAEAGARPKRAEERERLRLALHRHRLQLLVVEHALRLPVGLLRTPRSPFTGAAPCRREAVLTTSPVTIPSPSSGRAPSATTASPGVDPDPDLQRERRVRLVQLLDRLQDAKRRARTARSASSSCATGAPKTAITASPMNFSTVPP